MRQRNQRVKSITAMLLAALMCYMPAGVSVAATDIIASGECGDNLTWEFDSGGTLTISGAGEMQDYGYNGAPWCDYADRIYKIHIQDGVSSIGDYAFYQTWFLTEIEIPDGVLSIGEDAFMNCQSLAKVTIPGSVKSIGYGAFVGCSSLTELQIPNGVMSIGEAFAGCKKLRRLDIPASAVEIDARCLCENNGVTYIYVDENNPNYSSKDGVLFNKDGTELLAYAKDKTELDYTVPDGVEIIQQNAFQNCQWLKNVKLPDGIKAIEWSSFSGCTELLRMEIPNSIQYISNPFSNCDKLSEIVIDRAQGVVEGGPEGAPNAEIIYLREMHAEVLAETAYTGREIEPAIKISERRRDGTATRILAEKEEYIPYYSDNINAGTAKIEVCYIGDYIHLPNSELTFQITPRSCAGLTIAPIPNQACTGRAITPNPVITDNEI